MHTTPNPGRRRLLAALAGASAGAAAMWPRPTPAHGDGAHRPRPPGAVREQKPWGRAGLARDVQRTVDIRMSDDMRFTPDTLQVRLGETVRLRVRNAGRVMHELVLGTPEELEQHARLMEKFPDMEHDEPHMAHVAAGRRGEIVWHFNRAGDVHFACLLPGHYTAGMRGRITVVGP